MAYGDFKYLTRRTAFDRIFCDKAINIAKNPKCDGYYYQKIKKKKKQLLENFEK